jgi:RES domain-containing protein
LVWRHVPAGAEPLHLGWMQRARGRWNTQRPRVSCLYTANTREGAPREFVKLASERPAYAATPRDLVSLHVNVEPVADLTEPAVRERYEIAPADLVSPDCRACHRAMHAILRDGYRAIRAPSAAAPGEVNLLIYPERTDGRLLLSNGPHRVPINHGSSPLWP